MKKILFIALFVCSGITVLICCSGTNDANDQAPKEMIDSFFKIYEKNEPVKALDDLYSHAPWLKGKNDNIENLKIKFNELKNGVGEYHGQELLNENNVKNTFAIYTYLVKFENNPVVFTFEFYKPNKEWIVYSFAYDYSFESDLKNAIKKEIFESKK